MLLSHLRTLYFMHYKPGLIPGLIPGLSYSHRSTLGLVWPIPYSLFYTKGQEISEIRILLSSIPRKNNETFFLISDICSLNKKIESQKNKSILLHLVESI